MLVEGERLDQPTFHARYEAMPPGTRAELINGVVYMPSPVGRPHAREQMAASAWLNCYLENTPGVEGLDNASTALGTKSEPQPDLDASHPAGVRRPDAGRRRDRRGCPRVPHRSLPQFPVYRPRAEARGLRARRGSGICRPSAGARCGVLVRPAQWPLHAGAAGAGRDLPLGGLPGLVARSPGAPPGRQAPPSRCRRTRLRHARACGVRRQAGGRSGIGRRARARPERRRHLRAGPLTASAA